MQGEMESVLILAHEFVAQQTNAVTKSAGKILEI